ncbi:MAG TPA: hypothetical protein VGK19_21525 [Capsulimonadaceae bacterium]|jgi:hypothetical protein
MQLKSLAVSLFVLTAAVGGCGAVSDTPQNAPSAELNAAPLHTSGHVFEYPFGMCSNGNIRTNPEYAPAMLDAGARMVRADFTFGTIRPTSDPNPDNWNWKTLDEAAEVHRQYPKLEWLGLLGFGADWARASKVETKRQSAINAPQAGIEIMPVDDPRNYFGQYVYETVRRYKGLIHVWESWNEPDLPGGHYFIGNGADFLPYQKACYLAAKKADPTCKVLFASMTYANVEGYLNLHHLKVPSPYPPTSCFFEEYLKAAAKDPDARKNNYYFDIMNQHSYSRATDLYDYAEINKKMMRDYIGTEMPIWITEMGIRDNSTPEKPQILGCTPDEYGDYLLQSYAWGTLGGVSKFFHFQLDNSNGHGLYVRVPIEPKPALAAYKLLTSEFANATLLGQRHGHAGVGFLQGNSAYDPSWRTGYDLFEFEDLVANKRLWMAFTDDTGKVAIKIPAKGNTAVLIDRTGKRRPLTPTGGQYSVTLEGATNIAGWPAGDNPAAKALGSPEHLVGGSTVIVEEAL